MKIFLLPGSCHPGAPAVGRWRVLTTVSCTSILIGVLVVGFEAVNLMSSNTVWCSLLTATIFGSGRSRRRSKATPWVTCSCKSCGLKRLRTGKAPYAAIRSTAPASSSRASDALLSRSGDENRHISWPRHSCRDATTTEVLALFPDAWERYSPHFLRRLAEQF